MVALLITYLQAERIFMIIPDMMTLKNRKCHKLAKLVFLTQSVLFDNHAIEIRSFESSFSVYNLVYFGFIDRLTSNDILTTIQKL